MNINVFFCKMKLGIRWKKNQDAYGLDSARLGRAN